MDVELRVRNGDFVLFEGGDDGVESVTAGLRTRGGIADKRDLIIKRGIVDFGDSLVRSTGDVGVGLDFFDDIAKD